VAIRAVAADRTPIDERGIVEPRPQAVSIEYLGVNLTAPGNVVYRYRLDGLDESWQDAGNRTEAIYRRLPPGTYAFQVMASNGDGAWTAPVSRPFTVLPSFYQTTWFAILCAVAVILVVWVAFALRVRVITREVRARAEERADERIRIARELHDTLLQGIQGLLLTFHVAAQRMSPGEEAKPMLERALATADSLIVEGRNRVASLRSEHVQDAELVGALQNAANDLGAGGNVRVSVKRSGGDAVLRPHVADEVFIVGREALANAFRHACASHVELELNYGRRYFGLRCVDDGKGFGAEERDKSGHWGLQGMAERARKLGGLFRIRSEPGRGTEVALALPSHAAYEGHSRAAFYLGAWRLSERNPLGRGSDRGNGPL
jgi:signal transduction histidine kinase